MAETNGLYIVTDQGMYSGRRKYGGAVTTAVPYITAPTATDDPNWQLKHVQTFPVDIPVGGFDFGGTNGSLTSACAAYGPYFSSMAGSRDGSVASNNSGSYVASQTMSVQNGILRFDQKLVNGVGAGALYHPIEGLPGYSPTNEPWSMGPYRRMDARYRVSANATGYGFVGLFISNPWPQGGELDWSEGDCYSANVEGFHHWASDTQQQTKIGPIAGLSRHDYHTYSTKWMPGRVIYGVDSTVAMDTTTAVGTAPQKITFQGAQSGSAIPAATTWGLVELDWVAIYDWVGPV